MEKIKELRQEMKGMADVAKGKDSVIKQLENEYEKMDKSASRSA